MINRDFKFTSNHATLINDYSLQGLRGMSYKAGLNIVKPGSSIKDMNVVAIDVAIEATANCTSQISCGLRDGTGTVKAIIPIGLGNPQDIEHIKQGRCIKVEGEMMQNGVLMVKRYTANNIDPATLFPVAQSLLDSAAELCGFAEGLREPFNLIFRNSITTEVLLLPHAPDFPFVGGLTERSLRIIQLIDFLENANNDGFIANTINFSYRCSEASFADLYRKQTGQLTTTTNFISLPEDVHSILKEVVLARKELDTSLLRSVVIYNNLVGTNQGASRQLTASVKLLEKLHALGISVFMPEVIAAITGESTEGKLLTVLKHLDNFLYRRGASML